MTSIPFDTLKFVETLETAGIDREQAKAIIRRGDKYPSISISSQDVWYMIVMSDRCQCRRNLKGEGYINQQNRLLAKSTDIN